MNTSDVIRILSLEWFHYRFLTHLAGLLAVATRSIATGGTTWRGPWQILTNTNRAQFLYPKMNMLGKLEFTACICQRIVQLEKELSGWTTFHGSDCRETCQWKDQRNEQLHLWDCLSNWKRAWRFQVTLSNAMLCDQSMYNAISFGKTKVKWTNNIYQQYIYILHTNIYYYYYYYTKFPQFIFKFFHKSKS